MTSSHVVTGGGRGVGRGIAARLLADGDAVVLLERDDVATDWAGAAAGRLRVVTGSAGEEGPALEAARVAESLAPLRGWVNNAAVFRDARLDEAAPAEVVRLVEANLAPAVVGCSVMVRHLRDHDRAGAIVNVSSHQAQRAVRGALPYATAKAAVEGLTRALAVDAGPDGVRVNAVALGSVATERYDAYLRDAGEEAAAAVRADMARLHPLGRVGEVGEVADVVAFLLSDAARFVTGVVLPVDGGRAAQGQDPEST